ncbi:MAG: pyruvate kinase [Rhizobiales bacterium]|nr:pyruvate kinase [Hyphomicrobiales bacterium]
MTNRQKLARLLAEFTRLRDEIAAEGKATMKLWHAALTRDAFRGSALNLAHYLALRRRDISGLQEQLSLLGLSSLGRSEARVLPALDAVRASLSVMAGVPAVKWPSPAMQKRGADTLLQEQARIFGADPGGPRSRIMITMPSEAAGDPELVRRMIAAGGDCARINCAHDTPDVWLAIIANVRAAAKETGRACSVLMDLGGPKIRITSVAPPEKFRLHRGDRFLLTTEPLPADGQGIAAAVSHAEILRKLKTGGLVWINDGKIGARAVESDGRRALLEVVSARDKGERLKPEKGINLPNGELDIAPLTQKDMDDLDFVAAHADCVGFSFVQRPSDITLLQEELARRRPGRPPQPLILKIETPLAVRNLPRLIVQAGGRQPVAVMIARGDLAVEIGLSRLSEIQEEILWICEAAHVPVVWATQVLDTMVRDGIATRAEATDAAMGQRAECVMLNKGPHLVEAVAFLDEVLRRMDRHQIKKTARLTPLQSWAEPQTLA